MPHVTPMPVPYQHMNVPITGTFIDNNPCPLSEYLPKIRRTAIIQLVTGSLLTCFGFVAIILMAWWSYYATAIWSGLLIYVVTGYIGLRAASTRGIGMIRAYLGMSIIGSLMGFALTQMHIYAAVREQGNWGWVCQPGGPSSWDTDCSKSEAARVMLDSLIVVTSFFLFINGIVAASFGCCTSCTCCRLCCDACCGSVGCCMPPPPPTTAVFESNRPAMSGNLNQQGGCPDPRYAGMFIVAQAPPTAYQSPGMTYADQSAPLLPGQQAPPSYYGAVSAQNPPAEPPQQQTDEDKVALA